MATYTSDMITVPLNVGLDRYQELMRLPPAGFNGLYRGDDENEYDCPSIWTQNDRDNLALNLASAEQVRTDELGYYLGPRYVVDEEHDFQRTQMWTLGRAFLNQVGVEATTDIDIGHSIVLGSADTVTITVATVVTAATEICLYYPGLTQKIKPESVSIAGGTATIIVLRARLADPTKVTTNLNNPKNYTDDSNFLTTVDIRRCYTDESQGAYFVWDPALCFSLYGETLNNEVTQLGRSVIRNARLAALGAYPATYDAGNDAWTFTAYTKTYAPNKLRISYLSGKTNSPKDELLTARLSHTQPAKLSPCSLCWENDILEDESGLITPYGKTRAAVEAWIADSRTRVGQGGIF